MIPAAFEYHAPKSVEDALRLLERHGDEAKLLAGGHSLLPLMKLRLAAPRFIIDLGRVKGLCYVRQEGDQIAIGAMTTHSDVETSELLMRSCSLLPETASQIGDMQVRNRGTIGGSVAHADPAADYPAAILALDAELVATSSKGTRKIPASEFFTDMLTTALRPGEILTEVRVSVLGQGTGAAYLKLAQPASGYAVVGIASVVSLGSNGRIERIAVGVTGVGAKAYRAGIVEKALVGKVPDEQTISSASRKTADRIEPLSDIHAVAEYRAAVACVYAERAIGLAVTRARGKAATKP